MSGCGHAWLIQPLPGPPPPRHHFPTRRNRELGAASPHSCPQSLSQLVPTQGVPKYITGGFPGARLGRAGKDTVVNARCTLVGSGGDRKCSRSTPLEQLGQFLHHPIPLDFVSLGSLAHRAVI